VEERWPWRAKVGAATQAARRGEQRVQRAEPGQTGANPGTLQALPAEAQEQEATEAGRPGAARLPSHEVAAKDVVQPDETRAPGGEGRPPLQVKAEDEALPRTGLAWKRAGVAEVAPSAAAEGQVGPAAQGTQSS